MAKNGLKIIDSDIHVAEPADLWERYLEPAFKDRGPRPGPADYSALGRITDMHPSTVTVVTAKGLSSGFNELPQRQRIHRLRVETSERRHQENGRAALTGRAASGGEDPKNMLAAMDVEGIDISIVFRTQGAHVIGFDAGDGMDGPLAAAICRAYNNWARDYCDQDPARLKLAAQVPIHDVDEAVVETRRTVGELGAVCLVLPNHSVNERPWYDEYYNPFWAEAERLNVPVAFHGIQLARQQHLARRYMDNFSLAHSVAHPIEMMLAMGSMLTGGVFERFPKLRAAFLEGYCSWVPWWLYCLDEHEAKFGDNERFGLKHTPTEYFKRQCYVSVDPDEELLRYTVAAIGDDNIVISTDWPHDDSAYPNAIDTFLGLEGVSDESKRKILWDNCARLYGL
jgi:predicted TIM-barrel fold metal-dependent hydrolase